MSESRPLSRFDRIELSLDGSHACALLGSNLQEGEAEFAPIEGWPNATYKQEHAAMSAAYEALAKRLGQRPPFDIVREHTAPSESETPLPMVLHCPNCRAQHIDEPNLIMGWTNPPHRSHECQKCGCTWRPADVPTNGVAAITTKGKKDWAL